MVIQQYIIVLTLLGIFHFSSPLKLLARTSKSIVLLDIDPINDSNNLISTLVASVNEDANVILSVNPRKNLGYYLYNGILSEIELREGRTTILGKFGFHLTESPSTMAYEWKSDSMLIGVQGNHESGGRIESCLLKNISQCTVVLHDELDYLYTLVVYSNIGKMFWQSGVTNNIEMSSISGSNHERRPFKLTLKKHNVNARLRSPSVHSYTNRIYFIRSFGMENEIMFCELNSTRNCNVVARVDDIITLVVSKDYLIFTQSIYSSLMYCKIDDCESTKKRSKFSDIENIVLFDDEIIYDDESNICGRNNGNCSHHCLVSDQNIPVRCSCPIGVALETDQKTCNRNGIQTALFVSSLNGIFKISLDTMDNVAIPLFHEETDDEEDVARVDDIEYDHTRSLVYWIEDDRSEKEMKQRRFIKRGSEITGNVETILTVPSSVNKIKLDSAANNLLWLDDGAISRIGITSLTSFYSKSIVFGNNLNIKSFSFYYPENWLILTRDLAEHSIIEGFDFSTERINSFKSLEPGKFIRDIAVDNIRHILFWIETNSTDLQWVNLKTKVSSKISFELNYRLPQLGSLDILGSTLYINSFLGRSILKVNLENLSHPFTKMLETPIFGAKGMKAVSFKNVKIEKNKCSVANGHCEHICVMQGLNSNRCLCADGYLMDTTSNRCSKVEKFAIMLHKNGMLSLSATERRFDGFEYLKSDQSRVFKYINSIDVNRATFEIVLAGKTFNGNNGIGKIDIPKPSIAGKIDDLINTEIIIDDSNLGNIYDLAVDHISRNIYWSNMENEQIEVCDITGRYRKVIAWKQIKPRQMVLFVKRKVLYFVDNNQPQSIKKMSMSGEPSGGVEIINGLQNVISLTLDIHGEQLYWVEERDSWILSTATTDGESYEAIYVGKEHKPIWLSFHSGNIYYTENGILDGSFGVHNGNSFTPLETNIPNIGRFRTVDKLTTLSTKEKMTQCYNNHANCEQLCLPEEDAPLLTTLTTAIPYRDYCACSNHFVLNNSPTFLNPAQCKPFEHVIIAAKENSFVMVGLRRLAGHMLTWKQDPIVGIVIKRRFKKAPKSFSFHQTDRLLFWIEQDETNLIYFCNIDNCKNLHSVSASSTSACSNFVSLVVDSIGNQLYVSCYKRSMGYIIMYQILDNNAGLKFVDVIISSDASSSPTGMPSKPKDIAVFPLRNLFFYIDSSIHIVEEYSIIKCTLDGKHCTVWLDENIDDTSTLQADLNIESSRLFYTNRHGVWSRDIASSDSNIQHHYASPHANVMYNVAPIDENSILLSVSSGEKSRVFEWPANETVWDLSGSRQIYRYVSYEVQSKTCRAAQCSDICRYVRDKDSPTNEKFECLCPPGSAISPEKKNTCVTSITCLPWQFACSNGRQCIHAGKKCDGVNDCSDHSDESFALCRTTTPEEWPCDDGNGSVNRTLLCDGFSHCSDASDELHCRCERPHEYFDCGSWSHSFSTKCIPRVALCDRINDCEKGEDERFMMCKRFRDFPPGEAQWIYILLLVIVLILLFLIILFCCAKNDKQLSQDITLATTARNETSTLLQQPFVSYRRAIQRHDMVAMDTITCSGTASSCAALPPPNSCVSNTKSSSIDAPPHRFYAPPPSSASMSTYGVVPASVMRLSTQSRKKRRQKIQSHEDEEEKLPRTSTPRMFNNSRNKTLESAQSRPPNLPFTPINSYNQQSTLSSSEHILEL